MQQLYEAFRASDRDRASAAVAADPTLAIFAAALFGDTTEIEKLLAANRSLVTAVSPDGWFPLHFAAHFGHAGAARVLLNKGAQVNACSTNASRNMALHAAAAGHSQAVAEILIEAGADVNARQGGGFTPLHSVAQSGDIEFARLLTGAGADVNVRAENQQRPLDLALANGRQTMVDFLESEGASL
ncbi:MAG: ankyrin repeat domain-containing protein [Acidobacteriota bacterium]|nr:ankyrin repeat domain-containing protein [Acidobacteriota bacterium]